MDRAVVKRKVLRQRIDIVDKTFERLELRNGKAVLVKDVRQVETPATEMLALVDAGGEPVMEKYRDLVTSVEKTRPRMVEAPIMEEVEVEETEDVPSGKTRLGLRRQPFLEMRVLAMEMIVRGELEL
jgi:hypothetical protein